MKPQIEKVDHSSFAGGEEYFLTAYYQTTDTLSQSNLFFEKTIELCKDACTTGVWKIKNLK